MRRRHLITRLSPHRLPPAPPLNIEKRRREIELYDSFGPLTRRVIAETPIDIDAQVMLPEFRRQRARDRQERVFAAPDLLLRDDTAAEQDAELAAWLEKKIKARVEAALREKGLPTDYKPLRGRDKHG